jgi:hypothetical protein
LLGATQRAFAFYLGNPIFLDSVKFCSFCRKISKPFAENHWEPRMTRIPPLNSEGIPFVNLRMTLSSPYAISLVKTKFVSARAPKPAPEAGALPNRIRDIRSLPAVAGHPWFRGPKQNLI